MTSLDGINGRSDSDVVERRKRLEAMDEFQATQFALLLKRRGFWLELKRRERAQVRTEMAQIYRLAVPVPK